ncbi:PLP-dependent transferase [Lojkania enalia]|uniref:PLP-dependent transferase n=1 Tax=Lojkania enalia TaxID=147567 RepID=A0A9P4KGX5_9PLEO|nr:PLP-dependent transferase [Didymosphaeria enalia]
MASKELTLNTKSQDVKFGKELRKDFLFEDNWLNLNHGSFGTYPRPIREAMRHYQDEVEARPDSFILFEYNKLLGESRLAISKVLNAPLETIVFVSNATIGINTVLRNLVFEKSDHILYFNTIYGACENTVTYITETTPASAAKIDYKLPIEDSEFLSLFHAKVSEIEASGGTVKIAILDTIVSIPGVRLPFEDLTAACKERGVLSCIDGAHGVGHVELDLSALDPDFFVSNCHKWLFAPRGCAVFYVPVRNQHMLRSTLPTSHGFIALPSEGEKRSSPLPAHDGSAFTSNFSFVGTLDNTPYLCIPAAISYRQRLGGESAILRYVHTLALQAANTVSKILGNTPILDNATHSFTKCCLVNVQLPLDYRNIVSIGAQHGISKDKIGGYAGVVRAWMTRKMIDEFRTFMFVFWYDEKWWVRLSAQVYLEVADFEWAGKVLKGLCERVEKGEFVAGGGKLLH